MPNIIILASDIKHNKVCCIYISQNPHMAAYDKMHMPTPPKVFIEEWIKLTQMGRRKTRGRCESRNKHTKHNKEEKNEGLHTIRTTGNIYRGGGT